MEKTNLNVTPYYDDFAEDDNFHRVLFRPGFSVQARELTQLQSILQNQIERHGRHMFKEGTVVIPGACGWTEKYYAVKLQPTFGGSDISPQISEYVGTRITGVTSGVEAEVIEVVPSTSSDPITLYVKYLKTGQDNTSIVFSDGENISADATVGDFGAGIASAILEASNATATGSSANIQEGVYFVRGHFVHVPEQRIILDKYTNTPSYRIGLTITESLVTPEEDTSLLDNAQGTSNVNAKGAHRLKIDLSLAKLSLDSEEDGNFIELLRVSKGVLQQKARNTEYSVIGETLARRTFDESGDYVIRNFELNLREALDDGLNNGVYAVGTTTDSGNTASEDNLTMQVSPGKAYVRGYEIETIAPKFIDIPKPRSFNYYDGSVTPVEVGNYVIVDNVYNTPDLQPLTGGEIAEPYREVALFDAATSTRGQSSSGNKIGFARVRGFEHLSGNQDTSDDFLADGSTTDSRFKLYMFDLRMFTKLTLSGTPSPAITAGAKVTGMESGAYGYVTSDSTGTSLVLITVTGSFSTGEKLKSTSSTETDEILETSGNTDITISSLESFDFSSVKQVYMNDPDAGQDFTADPLLNAEFVIDGTVSVSAGGTTLTGFQTDFTTQLKVGDFIKIPSGTAGAVETKEVTNIASSTSLTIGSAATVAVSSGKADRLRAKLIDQNKNILIRKLQKDFIKTLKTEGNNGLSKSQVIVRKQLFDTSASGALTFSIGSNETFNAVDNTDYVLSILTAGDGSATQGEVINLNSSNVTLGTTGGQSLTITSSSLFGDGCKAKLVATVTRTNINEKTKTNNRCHLVVVDNDGIAGGSEYGTSAHHKDISLGKGDIHKLRAVYASADNSTEVTLPSWTVTGATGSFTKGETITGGTSGAKATVINPISPISYIPINNNSFSASETITGNESGVSATMEAQSYVGDNNVTNDFTFDNGQRDNFYDVARIVRKPTALSPQGKLLIVCDYFDHSSGDFFTVDSYSSIDYKDIPTYSATRVDPEVAEPTGEYDLRNAVDFRPKVQDSTNSITSDYNSQGQPATKITDFSFDFENRSYSGTGASTISIPKDNSNFTYDFEYYLGRIDMLFLDSVGEFKLAQGAPAEQPSAPKPLENAMKIATINLNPYIVALEDATYTRENNRRYTMRDIGKLDNRISNIEYYTALNLLEKDAQSLEILDSNGLNRFKSGFVVDNFAGHATGDVKHPDYRNSIDMENGELRPKYYMKGVTLEEENLNDTERTNDNYTIHDNIITLPYTHEVTAEQPYATRVENLNPVLNFSWAGICKLTPSGDEWFEVDRLPDLIINREGNFDTVLAANRNAIGTVWNAWQTQWSGITTSSSTRFRETSWQRARNTVPYRPVIQRTTTTEQGTRTRTGVSTQVVAQIDLESQGDRILSQAVIPFIRSRNVIFETTGMKPLTKVYPFFDKVNVTQYCTQISGAVAGTATVLDPTAESGDWTRIGKVTVEYDLNQNSQVDISLSYSDKVSSGYRTLTTQKTASTRSVTSDIMEFNLINDEIEIDPNDYGETFIKIDIDATGRNKLRSFQVLEIKFYDQDENLIGNSTHAEVVRFKNFSNAHRAVDEIVNPESNKSRVGETEIWGSQYSSGFLTTRVFGGARNRFNARVSQIIQTTDVESGTLTTDAAGNLSGVFAIPDPKVSGNPRFRTGERMFRLTSDINNSEESVETFAQALYSAKGILNTVQETIIATRNGRVETTDISQSRATSRQSTRDTVVGWWDPLAQSFMPQAEGGEYITKVDAYFSQKDESIPVSCQIREMQNGYPTTKVLPFASKTLEPDEVSTSFDATAVTTFEFDAPVYVKDGVEYCIVLFTDSPKYLCWISRMGETDVGGTRLVSEQPYLGVLFKSQNNTTWSAYDLEDLKFKLHRAKFDTNVTGVVDLINADIPEVKLQNNPIRTISGETKIKVIHQDHHMYDSRNNVTIDGVSSGVSTTLNGAITDSATSLVLDNASNFPTSGTVYLKLYTETTNPEQEEFEIVYGTISGTSVSSITRGAGSTSAIAHVDNTTIELYQLNGIPLTEINKTHTQLSNIQMDSYTVSTTTAASTTGAGGGAEVYATENAVINQMQTLVPTVEHPNTSIIAKVRTTSGTSPSGNEQSFDLQSSSASEVIPLTDNYLFETPRLVASKVNEDNEMDGSKSLRLQMLMQTEVDNLSPIIDLERKTLIAVANRLDNVDSSSDVYPTDEYIPATDPDGDSNEAIYVTRKVQLKTPGTAIRTYLDAVNFDSSEIQVMYKILRSDDASDFDEIGWRYFNTDGTPDETVNASISYTDYIERAYTVEGLEEFIAFAIKIRMQGTNSSEVPRIKDLRAIALAT
jgi:hypothetical protein